MTNYKGGVAVQIAFLRCNMSRIEDKKKHSMPPCAGCIDNTKQDILKASYVDEDLIEQVAMCVSKGDYDTTKLTPLQLSFAFSLLEDIVPIIAAKVKNESESEYY